jgi:hypothetical protein
LQRIRTQNTIKREGGERERGKQFYIGSPQKSRVLQSPYTLKGVHYNLKRLQMLKHTSKRLPNAQVQQQETSYAQALSKKLLNAQVQQQETSYVQALSKRLH